LRGVEGYKRAECSNGGVEGADGGCARGESRRPCVIRVGVEDCGVDGLWAGVGFFAGSEGDLLGRTVALAAYFCVEARDGEVLFARDVCFQAPFEEALLSLAQEALEDGVERLVGVSVHPATDGVGEVSS